MKRAALYARVSTQGQEDNSSLDDQIEVCRQYAADNDFSVVDELKEVDSGVFIFSRPQLQRVFDLATDRQIDALLVDKLDRLGREDASTIIEYTLRQFDVDVIYVSSADTYDEGTIQGLVLKQADRMVSGVERIIFRERTIRGKKKKIRDGKVMPTTYRPYGYRYKDGNLEIIEKEAEVVRRIYQIFIQELPSLRALARRLQAEKVPTMSDIEGRDAREPYGWTCATLRVMLRNEVYCGTYYWGKRKNIRREVGGRKTMKVLNVPEEEWIPVQVPAIVSRETWERAGQILDDNRKRTRGRPTRNYLLTKHFRCICGRAMCGSTLSRERRGYNCGDRAYVYRERCPHSGRRLPAGVVEGVVFDYLESIIFNPQNLLDGLRQHKEAVENVTRVLAARAAAIDAEIANAQRKVDTLLEMKLAGDIEIEVYRLKRGELLGCIKQREKERAEILERVEQRVVTETTEREVMTFCERVREGWKEATFEDKRKLLRMLAVEITYNGDDTVTISGFIPTQKLSISSECDTTPPPARS